MELMPANQVDSAAESESLTWATGDPAGTVTEEVSTAPSERLQPPSKLAASARRWGLPLVVLIAGVFMSVLGTNILGIALPSMQKDSGVSTERVHREPPGCWPKFASGRGGSGTRR